MDFVLPYRPLSGKLFDRKGGRSAIGWLLEQIIGHEQFSEFRTHARYSGDPIVLLKEVSGANITEAFVRDLSKISDCNDFGSKNALGYITAFAMLPHLLNDHRLYFESFSNRIDATLEKIECIMVPGRLNANRLRFLGTRLMELPLSAYLEGETCELRAMVPMLVWN